MILRTKLQRQKAFTYSFDKVNRYIRKYNETKYLQLFNSHVKKIISDRIKCLNMLKSITSDIYFGKYTQIKNILDDDLHSEKILNMYNVVIIVTFVFL